MNMSLIEDLNEDKDFIESLPVGLVNMGPVDDLNYSTPTSTNAASNAWQKWYPIWQSPGTVARNRIGDCNKMTAEYLLTIMQPYPGDEVSGDEVWTVPLPCPPYERFQVECVHGSTRSFKIMDKWANFEITIPKSDLDNRKFNLGHWYARHHARTLGIKKPAKDSYPAQLEDPLVLVAMSLLRSGIHAHYPNANPETETDDRFFVHLKDYGSSTYVVIDTDLNVRLEIDSSLLERPEFDLINWYLDHVTEDSLFCKKYIELHVHRYSSAPGEKLHLLDDPFELASRRSLDDNITLIDEVSVLRNMLRTLERCVPYLGDETFVEPVDSTYICGNPRFVLDIVDQVLICVYDRLQGFEAYLSWDLAN